MMTNVNKRQRYIAFIIENGRTDRRRMINALRKNFNHKEYDEISPWLTVFTGDKGIVRCNHYGKDRALKILNSISVGGGKIRTITTSGTIKKAKERLFEDD